MSKPADNLSALFRSLGPDDTEFRANTHALAQEAEQRWPLFKAVAPRRPEVTPTLSAQERQRWDIQDRVDNGPRKPALSLPGFSDKLAHSLGRIAEQAEEATQAANRKVSASPRPALNPAPREVRPAAAVPMPAAAPAKAAPTSTDNVGSSSGLFGKINATAPVPAASVEPSRVGGVIPGLFGAPATVETAPSSNGDDSTLANVFSRLEGDDKPAAAGKVAEKKPSFLDRLGKR